MGSWREKAASDAASSLLEHTKECDGRTTVMHQPFVYIETPVNPLVSCEGCYTKNDVKEVGVGNKMHSDKPHLVIHLCPSCRNMFGKALLEGDI